jgi:hypothetical protein
MNAGFSRGGVSSSLHKNSHSSVSFSRAANASLFVWALAPAGFSSTIRIQAVHFPAASSAPRRKPNPTAELWTKMKLTNIESTRNIKMLK